MSDDIVARLRQLQRQFRATDEDLDNAGVDSDWQSIPMADETIDDAADEIERLRARLLGEENAYDVMRIENEHLQADRNNLALEVERLRAERDEARREIVESLHPDLRDSYVAARGWDCFKETTDER